MSEIQIDVAKSWNELRWIDDQETYRSNLAQLAMAQIRAAKDLAVAVEAEEWPSAHIQLLPLLNEIVNRGIITKIDLIHTMPRIIFDSKPNKNSQNVLQQNLITCSYLVQNSLLQRGKKTKLDIAKIADLALHSKFKSRKELVYVYKGIVYPYFGSYDSESTIHQIKKDKRNASTIATTNFLALIGLSLDLTEQLKLLNPKNPVVPQCVATHEKPSNSNSPPVVVTDREGDAFHSLLIGRKTKISFHRTLRVPEDGHDYPLPAGLGTFPIHRVEDYADSVPPQWLEDGGFFIPLYQREALFIQFEGEEWCPGIAKVCVGQINAITGKPYSEKLSSHSQDYVVIPKQKWLDGINSGDGTVKQFVAMPLGQGYTVEAQITDEEKYGGFQIVVYEAVDGRFKKKEFSIHQKANFIERISKSEFDRILRGLTKREKAIIDFIRNGCTAAGTALQTGLAKQEVVDFYVNFRKEFSNTIASNVKRHFYDDENYIAILYRASMALRSLGLREDIDPIPKPPQSLPDKSDTDSKNDFTLGSSPAPSGSALFSSSPLPTHRSQEVEEMGIAAGGKINQQIFQDTYGVDSWDPNRRRLLKIHMVNSIAYQSITGQEPPASPITIDEYRESGIPWYSHYDENIQSLKGVGAFNQIVSGVRSAI
jgi:hypothetical protein